MTKDFKLLSFRTNRFDLEMFENIRREMSQDNMRKVTDADVIRECLQFRSQKKIIKKVPSDVIQDTTGNSVAPVKAIHREEIPNGVTLTPEQVSLGYKIIGSEICDSNGFPIEELSGDVVVRGGEVYATDPGRSELKEMAKENSEKILIETPAGKMNDAMKQVLGDEIVIAARHATPGMLETIEGVDAPVDESFNE